LGFADGSSSIYLGSSAAPIPADDDAGVVNALGGLLSPLLTPLQELAHNVLIGIAQLLRIRALLQELSARSFDGLKVKTIYENYVLQLV